jgi:cell filamentation protein
LGEIYEWAGEYRQVNVSKDGFPFAAAAKIPSLMESFERSLLSCYTPCHFRERAEIVTAIAETHAELVLIHPFREGNGRIARVLATLMALQAKLPLLDFSVVAEEQKKKYFSAVQAGLDRNYKPMETIFAAIIDRTLARS